MTAPTIIDLSSIPAPDAIEALSYEALNTAFLTAFQTLWATLRAANPELPDYDVAVLETDPVVVVGEAYSATRLLDRQRVNDAVKAVLAPLAKGSDLDNIVARIDISRLTVAAATDTSAAVMETDDALLRRYLLAFDRPSAGSADRYKFEAFTAVPVLIDVAVLGFETHGRRGDVDIVLAGPGGRAPTTQEIAAVYAACSASGVKPEATSISVIGATRALYTGALALTIPTGPDPATVQAAASASVWAAANARLLIGAQVPVDVISGAAYGANVIRVDRASPSVDIPADPYTIPVMTGLTLSTTVSG